MIGRYVSQQELRVPFEALDCTSAAVLRRLCLVHQLYIRAERCWLVGQKERCWVAVCLVYHYRPEAVTARDKMLLTSRTHKTSLRGRLLKGVPAAAAAEGH